MSSLSKPWFSINGQEYSSYTIAVWIKADAVEDFIRANPGATLLGDAAIKGRKQVGIELKSFLQAPPAVAA